MSDTTPNKRIHPLFAGAAVSVILVSLAGVAAITGLLPTSHSEPKAAGAPEVTAAAQNPGNVDASGRSNIPAGAAGLNGNGAQTALPAVAADNRHVETVRAGGAVCESCGTIESVRAIEHHAEQGSGLGAVAGAVLGGVLGHQVGGGNGQKIATVAGAVGGGYAGNSIEKRMHTTTTYEVRVKMENGRVRTFKPATQPEWHTGDRVRIVNGVLQAA